MHQSRADDRSEAGHPAIEYGFGPYRVRTDELLLRVSGAPVSLPPKAVKTLVALLDRAGSVVSKDHLYLAVWGDEIVEEANLSQNIYVLRRRFKELTGVDPIETLPRRGYRFTMPVTTRPAAATRDRNRFAPLWSAAAAVALLACGITLLSSDAITRGDRATPMQAAADQSFAVGWFYWREHDPESIASSIDQFEDVALRSPSSPLGDAGLAVAYATQADLYGPSPSAVADSILAERLARAAIASDARSAWARAARGFVEYDLDGDNIAAAADLRYAVREDPTISQAHLWYGAVLLWRGDPRAAKRELERAASLDPALPDLDYVLGLACYASRDYEAAIAYAQMAEQSPPSRQDAMLLLAAAYDESRQFHAAIGAVQPLLSDPINAVAAAATLAHVYAAMGEPNHALAQLQTMQRMGARDQYFPAMAALAFAANRRLDPAFAWLSHVEISNRRFLALDPRFDALRRDRRFDRWLHG
jgi:DNA-binding winged helix-turn-helix (wHTH) protein